MKKTVLISMLFVTLFVISGFRQLEDDSRVYKKIITQFYELLYEDAVSVERLSNIYQNGSVAYEKEAINIIFANDNNGNNKSKKEQKNINLDETNSFVFQLIKKQFQILVYGLKFEDIKKVIAKSEVNDVDEFTVGINLTFPNGKTTRIDINKDTPNKIQWIWIDSNISLEDLMYKH